LWIFSQTPLPINWDVSGVTNCDSNGYLSVTNNGSRVEAIEIEGRSCGPCTTLSSMGTCVLDAAGEQCSNTPNVMTSSMIDIGAYNQINLTAIISPISGSHEASSCTVGDLAIVEVIHISNSIQTTILSIGGAGLNNQVTQNTLVNVQNCNDALIMIIVTKSNASNEGFVFDISPIGTGVSSQIPTLQNVDIDIPTIGCPGGFTEVSILNCQLCTIVSATPSNGGTTIVNTGSSILIPIPPNHTGPLNFDITYGDGICSFTFPLDVPYLNNSIFQSNFFLDPFCPNTQFALPQPLNVSNTQINGTWTGPGVSNNTFTDPGNGPMTYTVTFTSSNCLGIQFDQEIIIGPNNYAGLNKLTGIESQSITYSTDGIIESEQLLNNPFSIDYNAGVEILLDHPFEVESGARFHAYIDGCN